MALTSRLTRESAVSWFFKSFSKLSEEYSLSLRGMQKSEVVQPKAVSASREFQLKIILESSPVLCLSAHLSIYCIDTFLKQNTVPWCTELCRQIKDGIF